MEDKVKTRRGDTGSQSNAQSDERGKSPADVGANLRRLRKCQDLSLETLAQRSGVSRAMLGQVETGKSVPTVTVLWKIAAALGVSASTLIESAEPLQAVVLPRTSGQLRTRSDGRFVARSFSTPEFELGADFQELLISPGHEERAEAYPLGSRGSIVVAAGRLEIGLDGNERLRLSEGDALLFDADAEQLYFNPGSGTAIAYLVVARPRHGLPAR